MTEDINTKTSVLAVFVLKAGARFAILATLLWATIATQAQGQTFTVAASNLEISAAPSFNHAPIPVMVTPDVAGTDLSSLTVTSDSVWVKPAWNAASSKIILSFVTSNLVNSSYTATVSAKLGAQTRTFFVNATVAPLNLTKLKDDPLRSRTYGVNQNGLEAGSVVVLDPVSTNFIANVTVGKKPTDLAESADGRELFVISSADKTITVIDLETLLITETIVLTAFDNWGVNDTSANLVTGPGNLLYYTDGAWAPALRVFNRSTRQVLQTVLSQGGGSEGLGDIAFTKDFASLYGWMQYGWSAGIASSYVTRFSVGPTGLLTYTDKGDTRYDSIISRDPLDTPVLVASDNKTVFVKGLAVGTNSASNIKASFPGPVYSITPGGEVVATPSALYDVITGIKLADLPKTVSVQTISSDYARFIYFDPALKVVKVLNLTDLIGPSVLNRAVSPVDRSITQSPTKLEWSAVPGIDRYNVYLGQSKQAVLGANASSPEFLGTANQPFFSLPGALAPGIKYYWRIDAIGPFDVTVGDVREFTVSTISCDPPQLELATVRGHRNLKALLNLTSQPPGQAWQASADKTWVTFTQPSGVTAAALEVVADASQLTAGLHQAVITISSGSQALFSVPLSLRVDTLNLTVIKSDPESVLTYAISEDTATTPARAYLLEINAITESIQRAVRVGTSATDLTIHKGDNRIYVPNWTGGSLLAIDRTSFQQVRSYAFSPFGGMGYSENDIYRISAGGPGRLVWEEQDQWIDINIFNTVTGTTLASAFVREGGGEASPDKRYYYHGENNSSGASLLKYDMVGDKFTLLKSARVATYSYYGTRTVVVSENGNRIFWNGGIFNTDLQTEWTVADQVYAASADGRFAFGATKIYDVDTRSVVATGPDSTVKAFNSISSKLVYKTATGFGFFRLGTPLPTSPADGAILNSATALSWPALPVPATYQVYLGTSKAAVAAANPGSPSFLGAVTTPSIPLSSVFAGTNYWRVDAVTEYGTVTGEVHSFVIVPIVPSVAEIKAVTFPNRSVSLTLSLAAAGPGIAWQAAADAPWISLNQASGSTPATIQVTLAPTAVAPAIQTGGITISGPNGPLYTLPVELRVEPLKLTIIKADPASAKAYAVSEDTATAQAHAYLLEIDTAAQAIERILDVGYNVTDLTIHNGDGKIYLPNYATGKLLAVDKSTFAVTRTYEEGDVYRVSAGTPGRLMLEGLDQWIDISIFASAAGTRLANLSVREGGGAHAGGGRYYYHGDNNSSGAALHRYDLTGDKFTELASIRVTSVSYYGSRTVVASEDGSRIYWNGSVFDAGLSELWTISDEIFSTSADGRYAFSRSKVYDTVLKTAVLGMPASTAVSAFNSTTKKLIVQSGNGLGFFVLDGPPTLAAPVLAAGAITQNSVVLNWTDGLLELGFTLQRRVSGAATWDNVANPAQNSVQYTMTGLASLTAYEFRIKADAGNTSSPWSDVLTVTTTGVPPTAPTLNTPSATASEVSLVWSNPADETQFLLERSVGSANNWSVLATVAANITSYSDTGVAPGTTYYYRVKARNLSGDSAYSAVRSVTVPAPAVPAAPGQLVAEGVSASAVQVSWSNVGGETGYRLERRTENPATWALLAEVGANVTAYSDSTVVTGTKYWYRVRAYNAVGNSPYSNEDDAVPYNFTTLLKDDFDPDVDSPLWSSITGATAIDGGQGFRASKALHFGQAGARSATTKSMGIVVGGTLEFLLRAGNEAVDGNTYWNNSESGENVVVEYSKDTGATWTMLATINTQYPAASNWLSFSYEIPLAAFGQSTSFRWRQTAHSGSTFDCWAIDDVWVKAATPQVPAPVPFIITSPSSADSVGILWIPSENASQYVLEARSGSSAWVTLATLPASITYYTASGLAPGTAYSYRVQAVNTGGAADYSPISTSYTWCQVEQWVSDNSGNPQGSQGLCVEFMRRKASTNPGVTYQVQFADQSGQWTDKHDVVVVESVDATWERVRARDNSTAADKPSSSGRVLVIQQ